MRKIIDHYYNYYINNISEENMVISLNVVYFLWEYLITFQPIKILERGSGFSTFIFALYKNLNKNKNVYLYSIDTHLKWLIKTNYFLRLSNLKINQLEIYNKDKEFNNKYDFIFEDTKAKVRKKTYKKILNLRANNGTIIFDDINAHGYIGNKLDNSKIFFLPLKNFKKDHRYPGIVTDNDKVLTWSEKYNNKRSLYANS